MYCVKGDSGTATRSKTFIRMPCGWLHYTITLCPKYLNVKLAVERMQKIKTVGRMVLRGRRGVQSLRFPHRG
jgi:hypothetical protein